VERKTLLEMEWVDLAQTVKLVMYMVMIMTTTKSLYVEFTFEIFVAIKIS
jgi:hypothetical protein